MSRVDVAELRNEVRALNAEVARLQGALHSVVNRLALAVGKELSLATAPDGEYLIVSPRAKALEQTVTLRRITKYTESGAKWDVEAAKAKRQKDAGYGINPWYDFEVIGAGATALTESGI